MKAEKDIYYKKLEKMHKAYLVQLQNVKTVTLASSLDMFKKKSDEVNSYFQDEAKRLVNAYKKMYEMLLSFNRKFK